MPHVPHVPLRNCHDRMVSRGGNAESAAESLTFVSSVVASFVSR